MFKKILIICIIIVAIGMSQTASTDVKEKCLCEIEKSALEFNPLLDSVDFENDVKITDDYAPHSDIDLATDYAGGEVFCAFGGRYGGTQAILIYKTTDGGRNWTYFHRINVSGQPLTHPSIAVTENYVCVAYVVGGNSGTIQTCRVPRTGGSGVFSDLPPTPSREPALTSYEGFHICRDTVHLVFVYDYGSNYGAVSYYQSTNGGYTWSGEYTFGLGQYPRQPAISHEPGWIYIAWPDQITHELRFARSNDHGSSFNSTSISTYGSCVEPGLCCESGFVYAFTCYPSSPYGKVLLSTNFGTSWVNDTLMSRFNWCKAECAGYAYAANWLSTPEWIVRSQRGTWLDDFTGTWTVVNDVSGCGCANSLALCTDLHSDAIIAWIDSRDGVYKAYCDGWNWTGIKENKNHTVASNGGFFLAQNYPNPVNSNTVIEYSLIEESEVEIKIYDITGKEISILVNNIQKPGHYRIVWDICTISKKRLPNGVYFYQLKTNNFRATGKMIVCR